MYYQLLALVILLVFTELYMYYKHLRFYNVFNIRNAIYRYHQKRLEKEIGLKIDGAIAFLKDIDNLLKRAGWKRPRRRQLWKDFIKHPLLRDQLYDLVKSAKKE